MSIHNINIENRLQQLCIENSEYAELWSTWNLNKQTLEPILNAIIKDYPHYSFHDNSHSESILLNIERILGVDNINKLSPTDLWLILHVSYLHDFGMVILDTKIYDIWRSPDFQEFVKEQTESADEDLKKAAMLINDSDKFSEEYDIAWPLDVKKATTVLLSSYCRSKHAEFSKEYILDIISKLSDKNLSTNCSLKISLVDESFDALLEKVEFGSFIYGKDVNKLLNNSRLL